MLKLATIVFTYLQKHPEQKFTAKEIADWVLLNYPKECEIKKNDSENLNNDVDLLRQIAAEISSLRPRLQKKYSTLKVTEERPRKYYYSEKTDSEEVDAAENRGISLSSNTNKKSKLNEHALYPLLSMYLWKGLQVYTKRIDEKRSTNNGLKGNFWLYPDVVGFEDLSRDWCQDIKNCVNHYSDKRTKLWSFEVKIVINPSNLRESYFQTVSNSSWANCSYLVAAEIQGDNTLKELQVLFSAHGIGLIKLNTEEPLESQILIPARERAEINWDTANRLATHSKDFCTYMKLIKQFYQTGEARRSDWDFL